MFCDMLKYDWTICKLLNLQNQESFENVRWLWTPSIHSEKRIRVADGLTKTIQKERRIVISRCESSVVFGDHSSEFFYFLSQGRGGKGNPPSSKLEHWNWNLLCPSKITLKETLLFDVVTSHGNNILFPFFWIANYISGNH